MHGHEIGTIVVDGRAWEGTGAAKAGVASDRGWAMAADGEEAMGSTGGNDAVLRTSMLTEAGSGPWHQNRIVALVWRRALRGGSARSLLSSGTGVRNLGGAGGLHGKGCRRPENPCLPVMGGRPGKASACRNDAALAGRSF